MHCHVVCPFDNKADALHTALLGCMRSCICKESYTACTRVCHPDLCATCKWLLQWPLSGCGLQHYTHTCILTDRHLAAGSCSLGMNAMLVFVCNRRTYAIATTSTTPGDLTATANLTKPDSNPANNQDSVTVTLYKTCGNPLGNNTPGNCAPGEYVGPDSKRILVNSTFNATCCVSGAWPERISLTICCSGCSAYCDWWPTDARSLHT
jgi:hypothetical protein